MPVAKQDRRSKRIHHEEHEGHEEWHSVQGAASATGRVQRRAPGLAGRLLRVLRGETVLSLCERKYLLNTARVRIFQLPTLSSKEPTFVIETGIMPASGRVDLRVDAAVPRIQLRGRRRGIHEPVCFGNQSSVSTARQAQDLHTRSRRGSEEYHHRMTSGLSTDVPPLVCIALNP